MKKTGFIIPIIFLILAIGVMEGGIYLKNIGKGKQIPEILNTIESNVKNDKWEDALTKSLEIKVIFNKTSKLIQYSVERNELFEFKKNLAQLIGYIDTQNEANAVAQIKILLEYWEELGT